jgi:hypothetical protein
MLSIIVSDTQIKLPSGDIFKLDSPPLPDVITINIINYFFLHQLLNY